MNRSESIRRVFIRKFDQLDVNLPVYDVFLLSYSIYRDLVHKLHEE